MDYSIVSNWTSPFQMLAVSGVLFHFFFFQKQKTKQKQNNNKKKKKKKKKKNDQTPRSGALGINGLTD